MRDLDWSSQVAIRETMVAVLVSPDIPIGEFHPRYGVTFDEMRQILRNWPFLDDANDQSTRLAIHGCLSEVCYGNAFNDDPSGASMTEDQWSRWFSLTRDELVEVFRLWRL